MKLKDAIGSRFVTDGNITDVKALLSNYPDEVYDLEDCLITGGIAAVIKENPLHFIDSKDKSRNKLLSINKEAIVNQSKYKVCSLPKLASPIMQYVRSLSNDVVYSVYSKKEFPLAAFVYLMCPRKKMTFGYLTGDFGKFLLNELFRQEYEEYIDLLSKNPFVNIYHEKHIEITTIEVLEEGALTSDGVLHPLDTSIAILPAFVGSKTVNDIPRFRDACFSLATRLSQPAFQELSLYDLLKGDAVSG